jgi:hypothetical protein
MAGVGDVGVPALQMSANPKVFLPQDEKNFPLVFSPSIYFFAAPYFFDLLLAF